MYEITNTVKKLISDCPIHSRDGDTKKYFQGHYILKRELHKHTIKFSDDHEIETTNDYLKLENDVEISETPMLTEDYLEESKKHRTKICNA